MQTTPRYKKLWFVGLITIALGVTLSTNIKDSAGAIGTVLIAVGGLLFIAAMSQKRQDNKENK